MMNTTLRVGLSFFAFLGAGAAFAAVDGGPDYLWCPGATTKVEKCIAAPNEAGARDSEEAKKWADAVSVCRFRDRYVMRVHTVSDNQDVVLKVEKIWDDAGSTHYSAHFDRNWVFTVVRQKDAPKETVNATLRISFPYIDDPDGSQAEVRTLVCK